VPDATAVLDGYTAPRRLRDAGYSGPIVTVTAHALAGKCREWIGKTVPPALQGAGLRQWAGEAVRDEPAA